ncbi:ATP-binding protein [Streptomyces sp. enrichment culture]|uniref:ATP-binding protein n=1 Tax=Streptomyces sp. enrichment culture TaxID=1795815 RepID=UPI003F54E79C
MRPDANGKDFENSHPYLLRAAYALDTDRGCIADARHHAHAFLDHAHATLQVIVSDRARGLTELVVSELVTNCRKYAPGPASMELRITARVIEVMVGDTDPVLPAARAADPGRIGQHGLEIVIAVTEDLLIESAPVGKRITARITLSDIPNQAAACR